MDITKKIKYVEWMTFGYLILFPFGQLTRINFSFTNRFIPIYPTDIIALISLVFCLVNLREIPKFLLNWRNLTMVFIFSFLASLRLFSPASILIGGLYLVRFIAYCSFFLILFMSVKKKKNLRNLFFNSLILVSVATAVFGWVQYLLTPDMRAFLVWGWDEHLFRLVGTFMDPTYTALIIIFGVLLSVWKYIKTQKKQILLITIFLILSVAFTYTRAAYLALTLGLMTIAFFIKKVWPLLLIGLLIIIILFLPRPEGEGIKLERTFSIKARFSNYIETFQIINKEPLLGVGFNNFCLAREKYLKDQNINSHACSGSDSSLLLIFATSGVFGLIAFFSAVKELLKTVTGSNLRPVFYACLLALLGHSLFANSLFYPWVLGFMAIFTAIVLNSKLKEYK
jgi:hypothetical protein